MSIAPLVLFAALAAAPAAEPDPTALVAKLGSAEPAERAAATESLKALGRAALPALQKAMKAGRRRRPRACFGPLGDDPARPHDAAVDGPARRPGSATGRRTRRPRDADRPDVATRPERPETGP